MLREYLALRKAGLIDALYVADKSKPALERAAKEGRLDGTAPSVKGLLPKVDAVHIATRNELHYPIAKEALDAGRHVLLEKPMTTDSHTAYELAERASAAGVVLQTGHIYRFNNAIHEVKKLLDKKYFGKIYYTRFQWTTKMPSPDGIDIVWDLMPHPLDIMHYLTGEWPTETVGVARSFRRKGPSETAFITALYPSGQPVNFELSWLRPIRSRSMEIVGEKRDAIVDCAGQKIDIVEDSKPRPHPVTVNNTVLDEVTHFVKSIGQRRNPLNSAVIGARNVQAIEAILKSVR